MKITSNDKGIIRELYSKLESSGENVELKKLTVEGAYGIDEFIEWLPKININIDIKINLSEIIVTWINRHYDYKTQILILKKDEEEIIIDTEVMKQGKPLEHLNVEIEENDVLHIETIKE